MDTRGDVAKHEDTTAADDLGGGGILVARALQRKERPYAAVDTDVPLVLEARRGETLDTLRRHIARNTDAFMQLLYRYGAVLLRGLPITTTEDFEETLFSIGAFRSMRDSFMSEAGRVNVPGSKRILHTNAFFKTGGTIMLGGFHSENYYAGDVPAFISFCCLEEPWMGGETGMVHMARAYEELGDAVKAKLESEPSCSMVWPIAEVAKTYGLDEATTRQFCREVGLDVTPLGGEDHLVLYKPNVLVHPHTGKPSLQLHVSTEIRGVDDLLRKTLSASAYAGPQWTLHRAAWRDMRLMFRLNTLFQVGRLLHQPRKLVALLTEQFVKPYRSQQRAAKVPPEALPPRAGRLLDSDASQAVAEAVLRHTNVFTWRRGDILILDNLQMLHSGMPGLGSRRIEVAICNPVPLRWPLTSGVVHVAPDEGYASVYERITALSGRAPQEPPQGS